ncbi:hypothetical protein GGI35DRAFT_475922 [Trichoderma velutinum]
MADHYQDGDGYSRYVAGDGRDKRNDATMPILQINNVCSIAELLLICRDMPAKIHYKEGQIIMIPGEVFCRWRGDDGHLCWKNIRYANTKTLRNHYRCSHRVETEANPTGGFSADYHSALDRWYTQVSSGQNPTWIPRSPSRQPPQNPPNPPPAAAASDAGNTSMTTNTSTTNNTPTTTQN